MTTTLNISIVQKRMLNKTEAAIHCGRPIKRFLSECPVAPIGFPNGDIRYDVKDLDQWLDGLKIATVDNFDAMIEELR